MKTTSACISCFVFGVIVAFFALRSVQPEEIEVSEYIRVEKRIKYNSDGTLAEAYFSFPTFEEYYEEISKESGFTIITVDLPKMSNSHSFKVKDWHSVLSTAPLGYESVKIDETTYKIQKK